MKKFGFMFAAAIVGLAGVVPAEAQFHLFSNKGGNNPFTEQKTQTVSGGETFEVNLPAGAAYELAVNSLLVHYQLDGANTSAGHQIMTAILPEKGSRFEDKAKQVTVTFIKNSHDNQTTVTVAVANLRKFKTIGQAPWGPPHLDANASKALAAVLQTALQQPNQ